MNTLQRTFTKEEYEIVKDLYKPVKSSEEQQNKGKNRNDKVKQGDGFIMINEQTSKIIDIIKNMDEKDKLRLAIALCDSDFSNVNFDKKEILAKADSRLREIDEEYKNIIVNMAKHKTVLLTTAMITELALEAQNKVVIFLVNSI